MASDETLEVYQGDKYVGRLHDAQPLRFEYDPAWQERHLSPSLPLSQQVHVGDEVLAYFENLLPEGDLRHHLELCHHTTTVFGLLKAIGGDTASSFTLLPPGESPAPPHYRPISWEALEEHLRHRERGPLLSQQSEEARISLAGAQDKLLLMVLEDGSPAIPEGSAPSSHILKPDIQGLRGVWGSAINETFCMQLAAELGLEVAGASYQPETRACLVRRYDRVPDEQGGLRRLHQLDFCQLAGTPSLIKYESDGGPGLARCRELLQQVGTPAKDLQRLIGWFFFNLLIGNNDSHAKNLAILYTDEGPRLAPFYDLMSTTLYSGFSRRFAFRVAEEDRPGNIERSHLESLARAMRFQPRYFLRQGLELTEQMPAATDSTLATLATLGAEAHQGTEQTLLERLQQRLMSNCRKLTVRWAVGGS
ncbi:phosphatidylinositol kinase [Litchfieldella anticariensis FP35 = DSM 16096]|uniref:Phosphatidylinositol kinase n=1 Tax=Litchfieldella anticariensis (strain DSM 16096 / CECT 5854 / CIP 108499 / LMG 22089 / FP35) TaxID=1121939 RepID=S2KMT6_LITA3|nr:type II toxin-antitoxin system HipA family toxin [Halomonas anticariensis]EPC03235.1 phosphatidylinositol kinase [Halomonas anticariensis FP35 = DSM 16096]